MPFSSYRRFMSGRRSYPISVGTDKRNKIIVFPRAHSKFVGAGEQRNSDHSNWFTASPPHIS